MSKPPAELWADFKAVASSSRKRKHTSLNKATHDYLVFQEIVKKRGKYVRDADFKKQLRFHDFYEDLSVDNLKMAAIKVFGRPHSVATLLKTVTGPIIDCDDQLVATTQNYLVLFTDANPFDESKVNSQVMDSSTSQSSHGHSMINKSSLQQDRLPPSIKEPAPIQNSILSLASFLKFATHRQNKEIRELQAQEFQYENNIFLLPKKVTFIPNVETVLKGGGLRNVELITIVDSENPKIKPKQKYILKIYKPDVLKQLYEVHSEEEICKRTVKMQEFATFICQKFNSLVSAVNRLNVVPSYFTKIEKDGEVKWATMEPFIEGEYSKYCNNDWNRVNKDHYNHVQFQSFGHYSLHFTQNLAILSDIQGIGRTLTDMEVATAIDMANIDGDQHLLFGFGNLHEKAINNFKEAHICNYLCASLKLPKLDLKPLNVLNVI